MLRKRRVGKEANYEGMGIIKIIHATFLKHRSTPESVNNAAEVGVFWLVQFIHSSMQSG
jgi:hypothetical protein